jgi:hypothetical protein
LKRRILHQDQRQTTYYDIVKAQLYLHKVCNAAIAGTVEKVEPHAILDPGPIHTRLDRMNETLDRIMDDSKTHRLAREQRNVVEVREWDRILH